MARHDTLKNVEASVNSAQFWFDNALINRSARSTTAALLAKCYNRMTNSLAKFALCFAVRDGCNQHCLNNDTVALKHLRRSITMRASYRRVGTIVPENRDGQIYKGLKGPFAFLPSFRILKAHPRTTNYEAEPPSFHNTLSVSLAFPET